MTYDRLSDKDLLAKLIGVREVQRVYQGSLLPLFTNQPEAGPASEKCAVARELVIRAMREEFQARDTLASPAAVRDYLRLTLMGREYEVFVVVLLDAQNRVLATEELFRGTLTQTSVYPREVVKSALRHNAAAVIFAHNHPSGVAEPSHADELLTQSLKQSLALVDIKVLDHFIVAGSGVLSFAERGLI
jgi:DNA repair protein RadC